jgi:hypothetical protein
MTETHLTLETRKSSQNAIKLQVCHTSKLGCLKRAAPVPFIDPLRRDEVSHHNQEKFENKALSNKSLERQSHSHHPNFLLLDVFYFGDWICSHFLKLKRHGCVLGVGAECYDRRWMGYVLSSISSGFRELGRRLDGALVLASACRICILILWNRSRANTVTFHS